MFIVNKLHNNFVHSVKVNNHNKTLNTETLVVTTDVSFGAHTSRILALAQCAQMHSSGRWPDLRMKVLQQSSIALPMVDGLMFLPCIRGKV